MLKLYDDAMWSNYHLNELLVLLFNIKLHQSITVFFMSSHLLTVKSVSLWQEMCEWVKGGRWFVCKHVEKSQNYVSKLSNTHRNSFWLNMFLNLPVNHKTGVKMQMVNNLLALVLMKVSLIKFFQIISLNMKAKSNYCPNYWEYFSNDSFFFF